jgi:hypothetical protein
MKRLAPFSLFGIALLLAALWCKTALADEMQGKLLGVYPDRQTLLVALNSNGNWITFQLDAQSKVFVNGQPAPMTHLKPGDFVSITCTGQSHKWYANEVHCQRR